MNQISPARSVLTKCNNQTLIIYHCPGASLPENTCFIPPDTNVFIVTEIRKKEKSMSHNIYYGMQAAQLA